MLLLIIVKFLHRLFVIACIVLLGSCIRIHVTHPTQSNNEVDTLNSQTVALVGVSERFSGTLFAYCGGVWVSRNKILTAAHCVEVPGRAAHNIPDTVPYDAIDDTIYIVNKDITISNGIVVKSGQEYKSHVIAHDARHDLALLEVENPPRSHATANVISESNVQVRSTVKIVGHPVGLWWTYYEGYVSAIRSNMSGPNGIRASVYQVTTPAWKGDSGSGVFDANGHLIGIFSWVLTSSPHVTFVIDHEEVKNFLINHDVI